MKLKTGRKILSFLLTIALLLGLMQGMGLTGFTYDDNPYAALVPTSSDDSNALNNKLISFNGNMWYIIEDNSTAVNSGTVTLLHATFLAKVPFSSSRDHTAYSGSSIEDFLNSYYEGSFAQFSNAIVPTDLNDVSVTGAKLYLLSTAEVQSLPDNVKKIGCDWWLRTQGNGQCGTFVGEFGNIADSVTYVTSSLAARPALQLDLSKVFFSDKTFSLDEDHNFTYTANGSTITAVCSAEDCSLPLVDGRHTATLTIAAPKHNTYGDGKDAAAVITDAYRIRGDAKISYQKKNGSNYGTASETAPTDAGDYKASITLGSATASIEYTIARAKTEVHVTIEPENPVYGQDVSITATVDGDAKIINFKDHGLASNSVGGATLFIDGGEIDSLAPETNTVTFNIPGLDTGEHTIKVVYNGDENYETAESETVTINIGKDTPEMTVTVTPENPVSDGSFTLTVNLPDDAAGNVIIRFNEVDLLGYIKLAEGNSQQFNCLQSGTYSGTARYMPDENSNYEEVTVKFSFRVSAAAPNMTLTADDITYGETASVTANLPTDTMWGSVTFFLDNADTGKEVYVSQGKAVCTFAGLNAGEHTVEAVFAKDDKYADETKTVTFTVGKATLTITANDQTLTYNGETQGEGDTAYEDPAEIAEKITVKGLIGSDEITSVTLDGQGKGIDEYDLVPSNAAVNGLSEAENGNYAITYVNGKLTIEAAKCALTINYVYENGEEAAQTYTGNVEIFKEYSVTSPEIEGYTPDIAKVEGAMSDDDIGGKSVTVTYTANTYNVTYIVDGEELTTMNATFGQSVPKPRTPQKEGYKFAWIDEIPETMPAEDITVNGAFTPIEYTATFVDENGETVEEVPYTVETQSITEPDVPEKQGYFGEWENYTLAIGGVTVKPVYRNTTSIELEGYTESSESGYKEDRTFTAKAENLPEGAEIHWFVNGKDVGTGDICTVEDPTDDYTVQAKVIDKDGNTLDETKVQPVKVKNGFFDRLKAFFAELIEKILGKAIADLLGSVC